MSLENDPMTTLIITPTRAEFDAFLKRCTQRGVQSTAMVAGRLPARSLPSLGAVLAVGGNGKTQFGIQTQYLLDHIEGVDLVACAGAAGALSGEVTIGDVVVATATVEHDYTVRFDTQPLPEFPGAAGAIASLRRIAPSMDGLAVHFGAVASGDEDVVDRERAAELHALTGALAVAWEGAGGARACAFNAVPYIEIRAISDAADAAAPASFDANLELAIGHIADLLIALFQQAALI
jgi:adenosylhomocysteine nucleosidase